MSDKLTIRLNIADRIYPMTIDVDDEEKFRKAAKIFNEKILQYKQRFTDKDNQDFLAMVGLHFVTQLLDTETKHDIAPVLASLTELNNDLDLCIKNSKINVL